MQDRGTLGGAWSLSHHTVNAGNSDGVKGGAHEHIYLDLRIDLGDCTRRLCIGGTIAITRVDSAVKQRPITAHLPRDGL